MKTEDIILIENNAGGEIHLVKDRLFWQAWERSAFLFVHNFKMKNRQLYKYGLKVYCFEFMNGKGRECLEKVVQNDTRRYPLCDEVNLLIRTSYGTLNVVTAPGFMFDGRSGPKIVDWYAPNLGTLEERVCWLVHDCNGYGQDLSFEDTNLLLFAMLRDLAGYRTSKANVIQLAVSLSKSWYGEPKEGDWCRANIDKVRTVWIPNMEE